jgi:DNA-binding beta-propeller fold protein YncE
MRKAILILCLVSLSIAAFSQEPSPKQTNSAGALGVALARPGWPGPQPDGSTLLPNAWSLRPAGKQIELGDFPVNVAVHPSGKFAAILHAGYSQHEIVLVDLRKGAVASRTSLGEAFYGIEFSADGRRLYCSGAGEEVVHAYDFQSGQLSNHQALKLRERTLRGVPSGLAIDQKGGRLFVAELWGNRVSRVSLTGNPEIMGVQLSSNGVSVPPVRPASDEDTAAANKRAEDALYETGTDDAFPYACRLDEKQQRLYVSLWGQACIAVVDLKSNQVIARWPTEEHPCEMALSKSGKWLFVADANRNTVTVIDTQTGKGRETISAAFFPQSPPGSTPNSLALSPDQKTLFVANANVNAIAVFDVSAPGKSKSLGFIPTGWYPTSVRVTPDGRRLLVASGKGIQSFANPHGAQPGKPAVAGSRKEYIAQLMRGSLGIIDLPRGSQFGKQMLAWTADVFKNTPLKADAGVITPQPAGNPVPFQPGDASPIRYCLYIIKENRTYDQVFGDIKEGNGDSNLCIFPERVTPNHHKLAREYGLLDNFYVDAEVSADGHEWSMGAYATDFVEKLWPLNYGHNRGGKYPYPSEGVFPIATPAGGYLWDRAAAVSVTYRSYGEFVSADGPADQPAKTRLKKLQGHFDPYFRSFDMAYSDLKRADRYISELKRFEAEGEMPRLQIIRLPNDHTHGTTANFPTPTAYLAQNDAALGKIVEAVSRSKFWPQTAIFVLEDDAQNGPDHVDAHRSPALVISPYCRRNQVDSTMYSTSGMLRTIELILGMQPMSQFDAAATPMFNCFQPAADTRPYEALPPGVNIEETNTRMAWGSGLQMNFAQEDATDEILLNEAVWKSVRGADSSMPAPVHVAFVFAGLRAGDDDDDAPASRRIGPK